MSEKGRLDVREIGKGIGISIQSGLDLDEDVSDL